jgi:hypothetical protein
MTSVESVACDTLQSGSTIDVETTSRHYQIECLGGDTIRISGHPEYCPSPVRAHLEGSVDRAGYIERGRIECGRRLRFLLDDDHPITTSPVRSVHVDRPEELGHTSFTRFN